MLAGLVEEAEDLGRVAIPIEGMALSVGRHVDVDGVGGVVVERRHSWPGGERPPHRLPHEKVVRTVPLTRVVHGHGPGDDVREGVLCSG